MLILIFVLFCAYEETDVLKSIITYSEKSSSKNVNNSNNNNNNGICRRGRYDLSCRYKNNNNKQNRQSILLYAYAQLSREPSAASSTININLPSPAGKDMYNNKNNNNNNNNNLSHDDQHVCKHPPFYQWVEVPSSALDNVQSRIIEVAASEHTEKHNNNTINNNNNIKTIKNNKDAPVHFEVTRLDGLTYINSHNHAIQKFSRCLLQTLVKKYFGYFLKEEKLTPKQMEKLTSHDALLLTIYNIHAVKEKIKGYYATFAATEKQQCIDNIYTSLVIDSSLSAVFNTIIETCKNIKHVDKYIELSMLHLYEFLLDYYNYLNNAAFNPVGEEREEKYEEEEKYEGDSNKYNIAKREETKTHVSEENNNIKNKKNNNNALTVQHNNDKNNQQTMQYELKFTRHIPPIESLIYGEDDVRILVHKNKNVRLTPMEVREKILEHHFNILVSNAEVKKIKNIANALNTEIEGLSASLKMFPLLDNRHFVVDENTFKLNEKNKENEKNEKTYMRRTNDNTNNHNTNNNNNNNNNNKNLSVSEEQMLDSLNYCIPLSKFATIEKILPDFYENDDVSTYPMLVSLKKARDNMVTFLDGFPCAFPSLYSAKKNSHIKELKSVHTDTHTNTHPPSKCHVYPLLKLSVFSKLEKQITELNLLLTRIQNIRRYEEGNNSYEIANEECKRYINEKQKMLKKIEKLAEEIAGILAAEKDEKNNLNKTRYDTGDEQEKDILSLQKKKEKYIQDDLINSKNEQNSYSNKHVQNNKIVYHVFHNEGSNKLYLKTIRFVKNNDDMNNLHMQGKGGGEEKGEDEIKEEKVEEEEG